MPNIISVSPDPLPHEKSKLEQVKVGLAMMDYGEVNKKLSIFLTVVDKKHIL